MKKMIVVFLIIALFATGSIAADVKLDWDVSPGATGYFISISVDQGATWGTAIDAKAVKPYTVTGVPDDRLVLFKIAGYNTGATAWNNYAFAAYDGRLKLLPPSGPGIK
jgi:hypothetical protein